MKSEVVEPHPSRLLFPGELKQVTPIAELKPGVKNLNCLFILLEKTAQRTASNGHSHCTVKVADESGAINLTLWDEAGEYLQPGDVCALRHGSTSVYKGVMSLNAGKNAEITKVNRIVLGASLTPDMSAYSGELDKFFSSKAGPDDSEDTKGHKRVPPSMNAARRV